MVNAFVEASGDNIETSPSLYAFFDQSRYLFDCGEGTQRYFTQRQSINITKVTNIFITSLKWESIGGLLGLMYTVDDVGIKQINLYGPRGLHQLFRAARDFSSHRGVVINIYEVSSLHTHSFSSSDFHVTAVPAVRGPASIVRDDGHPVIAYSLTGTVFQQQPDLSKKSSGSSPPRSMSPPRSPRGGRKFNPRDEEKTLDPTYERSHETCISYICSTNDFVGKFLPERAAELGIPKGPIYGRLVNGHTITLPNGTVVQPREVMEEPSPATRFAIIRCPDTDYFDTLLNSPAFDQFFDGSFKMTTIFHITPPQVLNAPRYIAFMERFGSATKHVVMNRENASHYPSFQAANDYVGKLSQFLPSMFASPPLIPTPSPILAIDSPASDTLRANLLPVHKLTRVTLGPASFAGEINYISLASELDYADMKGIDEYFAMPEVVSEIERINKIVKEVEASPNKLEYPKILFTGTGSSMPCKYRNVTGHHVLLERGGLLLDCGEGTYGQIVRFYGEASDKIILDIKMIWISHIHADHHLGIPRIIEKRMEIARRLGVDIPPVVVVGPPQLVNWMRSLINILPLYFHGITTDSYDTDSKARAAAADLGILSLKSVPVIHCYRACGAVIELDNGVKFTFSGDTRPCPELEKEGKGSTFLIHEATFGEDFAAEAVMKKHSTLSEALGVAKNMEAKFTILTHFSQRYPKLTQLASATPTTYGIAFDLIRVSPYQFPLLPLIIKPAEDLSLSDQKEKKERAEEIVLKKCQLPTKSITWLCNQRHPKSFSSIGTTAQPTTGPTHKETASTGT
eukprot:gene16874-20064_t